MLLRHGLTAMTGPVLAGHTPGLHLDERGQKQAAAVAERLAAVPLAAIVSSPLDRCLDTAGAVLAAQQTAGFDPQWQVDERIVECRYGDWTGKAIKDLAKEPMWKVVQQQPSAAVFPGGEGLGPHPGPRGGGGPRLGPPAGPGRGLGGVQPRRRHQGHRRRRAGHPSGPVPAHRRRSVLDVDHPLRRRASVRHEGQRHRLGPEFPAPAEASRPPQVRRRTRPSGGGAGPGSV